MTYKKVKNLRAEDFKRLTGVHFATFNQMVEIVKQAENLRKKTGRPPKLKIEDQILMVLEYLRKVTRVEASPTELYESTELIFI